MMTRKRVALPKSTCHPQPEVSSVNIMNRYNCQPWPSPGESESNDDWQFYFECRGREFWAVGGCNYVMMTMGTIESSYPDPTPAPAPALLPWATTTLTSCSGHPPPGHRQSNMENWKQRENWLELGPNTQTRPPGVWHRVAGSTLLGLISELGGNRNPWEDFPID